MSDQDCGTAIAALDERRRRVLYRASHRGTKEMDLMLGRFAEAWIAQCDEAELAAFEELLAEPDPDLAQMLLAPESTSDSALVHAIRRFHGLGS